MNYCALTFLSEVTLGYEPRTPNQDTAPVFGSCEDLRGPIQLGSRSFFDLYLEGCVSMELWGGSRCGLRGYET